MEDLTTIIEDSVTDVEMPAEPVEDTTPDESLEAAPEALEAPVEATETPDDTSVESPATRVEKPADDFEKKFGITAQSSSGRENRIPYSRVKKITDRAVKDAQKEWEKTSLPKVQELEAKVQQYEPLIQDYSARLGQVAEFERVMTEEPLKFLQMLSTLPQYAEIFSSPDAPSGLRPEAAAPVVDDMPQPNQELPDGSMSYDMEGLKALLAWQAKQVEDRVTKQVESRYAPLETDYQNYHRIQSVIPQVQQQIAEARTWPLFNEAEADIVKVLQNNPNFSLERAYQQVVFPKLQADRDKMRADLLKEVKNTPRTTSASTAGGKAPVSSSTGPRSLEDIIAESVKGLRS